jgi:hypothetical protein
LDSNNFKTPSIGIRSLWPNLANHCFPFVAKIPFKFASLLSGYVFITYKYSLVLRHLFLWLCYLGFSWWWLRSLLSHGVWRRVLNWHFRGSFIVRIVACSGALRWGTALQARRSRILFPMLSLEFFIDIILRPHYGPVVDSASNRNEYQEYFLGVKAAGAWGWQPYHLHVPIVLKSGILNLLET